MGNKVLKWALFASFLVCLYVSIPHLAWVFHSWDRGSETPLTINLGVYVFTTATTNEWFDAYLQAMTIDIIIALLSITLTNSKKVGQTSIGYLFITLLIGISWLFNWTYAKEHAPVYTGIWTHAELWSLIHLDTLIPIIVSALPVFALAFTIMLDRVSGERLSAEQLAQEIEEIEAYEIQKRKLASIKQSNKINGANALIDVGVNVIGHLINKSKQTINVDLINQSKPEVNQLETDINSHETKVNSYGSGENSHITDDNQSGIGMNSYATNINSSGPNDNQYGSVENSYGADINQYVDDDNSHGTNVNSHGSDINSYESTASERELNESSDVNQYRSDKSSSINLLSGHSTVSIEDAAKLIDCSIDKVSTLLEEGTLKTSGRNKQLITVASINKLIHPRKINQYGPLNETKVDQVELSKLEMTINILREDQQINDEDLAKKLNLRRPASARFWRLKAEEMKRMNSSAA